MYFIKLCILQNAHGYSWKYPHETLEMFWSDIIWNMQIVQKGQIG